MASRCPTPAMGMKKRVREKMSKIENNFSCAPTKLFACNLERVQTVSCPPKGADTSVAQTDTFRRHQSLSRVLQVTHHILQLGDALTRSLSEAVNWMSPPYDCHQKGTNAHKNLVRPIFRKTTMAVLLSCVIGKQQPRDP